MKAETMRLRTAKIPDLGEIILALGRAPFIVESCHGITVMARLGCCLSICARGSGRGSRMSGSQARRAKSCGRGICSSVVDAGQPPPSVEPAVGPGAAGEFEAFCSVYAGLPDLESILVGKSKATFPAEASARYATVLGLLMEAKRQYLRGQVVTRHGGSAKAVWERMKEWFMGNF